MTKFTEDRATFIGASEMAAIMGLSKYRSARLVWEEKIGKRESEEENYRMAMGKFMEPFILEWGIKAAREKGFEITDFVPNQVTFRHPKYSFIAATPDGFGRYKGKKCTLETKFANDYVADKFGQEGSDQCPDEYVVQVVTQMMCCGAEYGFLFASLSNRDVVPYLIDATDSEQGVEIHRLGREIISQASQFWKAVEDRVMPALSGQECDTQYVREAYSYEDGSIVAADEDTTEKVRLLKLEEAAIKVHTLARDELKNQLREYMGPAAILETIYGDATNKADKNGQRSFRAAKVKIQEGANEEPALV